MTPARAASDIFLMGGDIAPNATALHISRQSTRRIKENSASAAANILIAGPRAMGGAATPLLAALTTSLLTKSLSSLPVTLNALRMT